MPGYCIFFLVEEVNFLAVLVGVRRPNASGVISLGRVHIQFCVER